MERLTLRDDDGRAIFTPYGLQIYCSTQATADCICKLEEALKAQEPRLVEPNDFENADDFNWLPAWCEERTGAGYWEMILPDALDEKDVRYWTGRPTDEQRRATPWN